MDKPRKGSFACDDETEEVNVYKYALTGAELRPGERNEGLSCIAKK